VPKLPDETITFLYTDIEGSTPLWDQNPRAMSVSQAQHNKLLYQTIGEHQGQVFKVIGDAFQAVFVSPVNAVEAAIAIQHNMAQADWGETGKVLVRIGIHIGTVKSEGSDYISSHTQNRVARIMSAGHGGQILLSLAVAELVHGNLPPEVELQDLGEHYLKGISRPEHIFQVLAPGLQEKFPPLSTRIVPRGYTLLDQIGAGSFGGVYRAMQPDVGREVAVKIILPQYANDPEFIRRFEFEAQTVARLEHP
jgi:class 3 adenylate cyclase